jgi:hypothetical protein
MSSNQPDLNYLLSKTHFQLWQLCTRVNLRLTQTASVFHFESSTCSKFQTSPVAMWYAQSYDNLMVSKLGIVLHQKFSSAEQFHTPTSPMLYRYEECVLLKTNLMNVAAWVTTQIYKEANYTLQIHNAVQQCSDTLSKRPYSFVFRIRTSQTNLCIPTNAAVLFMSHKRLKHRPAFLVKLIIKVIAGSQICCHHCSFLFFRLQSVLEYFMLDI